MPEYLNLSEAIYYGVGKYEVPEIKPVYEVPYIDEWKGFNFAKTTHQSSRKTTGINFFLDDYQFERVWNYPEKYAKLLKQFGAVLSPDFSMYGNFPTAVQIFNHYRRQWLGRYWQERGITVIPTACWADKTSFEWCFDGLPKHSIIAVGNVGRVKRPGEIKWFLDGYNTMLEVLQPTQVLFFTKVFKDIYQGPITYIKYTGNSTYNPVLEMIQKGAEENGEKYGDKTEEKQESSRTETRSSKEK